MCYTLCHLTSSRPTIFAVMTFAVFVSVNDRKPLETGTTKTLQYFARGLLTLIQNNITLGNKITSTVFFSLFFNLKSFHIYDIRLILKLLCQQHVSARCTNREIYDKKTPLLAITKQPYNNIWYNVYYTFVSVPINPHSTHSIIIPCSRSVKESLQKSKLTYVQPFLLHLLHTISHNYN